MLNLKIFVETEDDIRIIRRIKRDLDKRNRTLQSITEQYIKTVKPMHLKFVEPTKKYADIIVPGDGIKKVVVNLINKKINSLLNQSYK